MSEQSGGMPNWLIGLALPVGVAAGWLGVNAVGPGGPEEKSSDIQSIAAVSAEEQALITARDVAEAEATQVATRVAQNVGTIAKAEAERIARTEALQIAEAHVEKRKAELAEAEAARKAAEAKQAEQLAEAEAEKMAAEKQVAQSSAAEKAAAAVAETAEDVKSGAAAMAQGLMATAGSVADDVKDAAGDAKAAAEAAGASMVEAGSTAVANIKAAMTGDDEKPAEDAVKATVKAEMTAEIETAVDAELLEQAKQRAIEAEEKLASLREAQREEDKDTAELLAKLQTALAEAEQSRAAAEKELAALKGQQYVAPATEEQAPKAAVASAPPPAESDTADSKGESFMMRALAAGGADVEVQAEGDVQSVPTTIIVDGREVTVSDSLEASSNPMQFGDPLDNFAEPPPRDAVVESDEDSGLDFFMQALKAGGAEVDGPTATTIVLDGRTVAVQDTMEASRNPMVLEGEETTVAAGQFEADDAGFIIDDIDAAADDGRGPGAADATARQVALAKARAEEAAAAAKAAALRSVSKPFSVAGLSASKQASMKSLKTLKQHRRPVWGLSFSQNGQVLASGGSERLVKTYNLRSEAADVSFKGAGGYVSDVAYSPNGKKLAAASGDGAVRIYNASTGRLLRKLNGDSEVSRIAFTPDSGYIAVGYDSGKVNVFGADSGKLYRSFGDFKRAIGGLSVSADGKLLAGNELDGDQVVLWNIKSGKELNRLGSNVEARTLQFKGKGSTLAVASGNGKVTLWNAATGKLAATLQGHNKAVDALAFSGNGKLLATGGLDQTVVLWDVAAEKKVKTLTGHGLEVFDIAFAPSGEYLAATGTGRSVKVWSISK